ncbi:MAG: 4Fe-4S cluster-binding domain-containing protein [Calditrichaeota bacterium]|nr:MAG: 4Fe-4S cluster-binding domain-containing protein [Calditrichota bacterium]
MPSNDTANHPHFMIIPSLHCPASCSYCFGPNHGPQMSEQRMEQPLRFINKITQESNSEKISITFHGGEPLAAGHDFCRLFLEQLAARHSDKKIDLNIQSNLWLLDDEFCGLFKKYNV